MYIYTLGFVPTWQRLTFPRLRVITYRFNNVQLSPQLYPGAPAVRAWGSVQSRVMAALESRCAHDIYDASALDGALDDLCSLCTPAGGGTPTQCVRGRWRARLPQLLDPSRAYLAPVPDERDDDSGREKGQQAKLADRDR